MVRAEDREAIRLKPRSVHPLWAFAAAASVVSYLGWALHFASSLY